MTRFLRPNVFAVTIAEDVAVLDLASDRYLCLTGAAVDLPAPLDWDRLEPSSALVGRLTEAGLLLDRFIPVDRGLPARPIRSVLHDGGPDRIQPRDVIEAMRAVVDVRRALRRPGLTPLLVADPAHELPPERSPNLSHQAARAFARILPWLPIDGACLVRSALLFRFLRRQGLRADWVFGVRLWPFAAHCWVQDGEVCLNDDAERLIPYTPIYRR